MPVGTQGTVKAMLPRDLSEIGCQILLGNTYHLYLRPGHELIRQLGGLHRFMGWERADPDRQRRLSSFQFRRDAQDHRRGRAFQSHLDGSAHLLTPEKAVEIQEALGSDIAMVLDECIAARRGARLCSLYPRNGRFAGPSAVCDARSRRDQLMFGIIQGGLFEDLRRWCVDEMAPMAFEGFAVGGLGVGEGEERLNAVGGFTADLLPDDKPRYLMGVGRPQDIIAAVRAGFDMFDCVIPTRNARNGTLFTSKGKFNIKRAEFADDPQPPVDDLRLLLLP